MLGKICQDKLYYLLYEKFKTIQKITDFYNRGKTTLIRGDMNDEKDIH